MRVDNLPLTILYIHAGVVPPPSSFVLDRFHYLSRELRGFVLLPVWFDSAASAPTSMRENLTVGRFRYHFCYGGLSDSLSTKLRILRFFVHTGLRIFHQHQYDCIVCYGHTRTALAGVLLKFMTGSPLIVEINGDPTQAFRWQLRHGSLAATLKHYVSRIWLLSLGLYVDRFKLLFPWQLRSFGSLSKKALSTFHDFVPTSQIQSATEHDYYILSVGHPWYLKGGDLLVKAFQEIAHSYPGLRLIVIGHEPDSSVLDGDPSVSDRIQLLGGVPYPRTLQYIRNAAILAHPARTEAMGRVLIEAMAAGTPVVASNVGGIPHYVADGYNGLLFRSGDAEDLAAKLRVLLSDQDLRDRIVANGLETTHGRLSDTAYVEQFRDMILATRKLHHDADN